MSSKTINLTLKVWRQPGPKASGRLETYKAENISTDASFLEMLDIVNEGLTLAGKEPIAFDHDCREGICGMCGTVVNGRPHGPERETTLCQLHMRHFRDGDTVVIEPLPGPGLPADQRPGGGPWRPGRDHHGRGLHLGEHRPGA